MKKDARNDDGLIIKPLPSLGNIGNTPITPTLLIELWREEWDIVHTHLPTPWSADWSRIVSIVKKRPLILTYHSKITGLGMNRGIAEIYNNTAGLCLFKAADKIILTRGTYLPHSLNRFREKIEIVPIGVDVSKFFPIHTEKKFDIFFLSILDEFHHFKGLDILLKALQRIKIHLPGIRVLIGGEGSFVEYYRNLARSLGVEEHIRFSGYIPENELCKAYNSCSVFVLPSTDPELETFGIVLLEAMACGRPVVTTEIAGPAEDILACGAGIIAERNDANSLADAILTILMNEGLGEQMGKAGRKLVEDKYEWSSVAARVEQLYKDIL
jgi:glycosyltransferase involved in cell wall biosynthesis